MSDHNMQLSKKKVWAVIKEISLSSLQVKVEKLMNKSINCTLHPSTPVSNFTGVKS